MGINNHTDMPHMLNLSFGRVGKYFRNENLFYLYFLAVTLLLLSVSLHFEFGIRVAHQCKLKAWV